MQNHYTITPFDYETPMHRFIEKLEEMGDPTIVTLNSGNVAIFRPTIGFMLFSTFETAMLRPFNDIYKCFGEVPVGVANRIMNLAYERRKHLDIQYMYACAAHLKESMPDLTTKELISFVEAMAKIPGPYLRYLSEEARFLKDETNNTPWDYSPGIKFGLFLPNLRPGFDEFIENPWSCVFYAPLPSSRVSSVDFEDKSVPVNTILAQNEYDDSMFILNSDGNICIVYSTPESVSHDAQSKPKVLTRRYTFLGPHTEFQYVTTEAFKSRADFIFRNRWSGDINLTIWELDRIGGCYNQEDFEFLASFVARNLPEKYYVLAVPKDKNGNEFVPRIPYAFLRLKERTFEEGSKDTYFFIPPGVNIVPFVKEHDRFPTLEEATELLTFRKSKT